jgi:transketolase
MLNKLERRIIDLSFRHKLSHIGSCLLTVNYLDRIYSIKKPNEPFIMDNGHAGLALYVILEKYEGKNAEELYKKHGVHPNRDKEDGIWASTGSLGHGIGIAVGMALSDPKRLVYVTISDGGCAEGSVWEALAIARKYQIENLRIALIANGYSAYDKVDIDDLDSRLNSFYPTLLIRTNMFAYPDFLQGQNAHYQVMTKEQYEEIIR